MADQIRAGQAVFNAFYQEHPELARALVGSDVDPFYDDSRLEAFHAAVNVLLGK